MTWYVVDGMDGSGKSTVARRLCGLLESRGRTVKVFTHPNRSRLFGNICARLLVSEGRPAAMAATAFYLMDILSSLIGMRREAGRYDDFIFVRYTLAAAYLPARIYGAVYRLMDGVFPSPDVRIFVDADPDTALERIDRRGEEREMFETRENLVRTRERMALLTRDWIKIDNSGDRKETENQLSSALGIGAA